MKTTAPTKTTPTQTRHASPAAMGDWQPLVPPSSACKCCNAPAPLFGITDFSKNCEGRRDGPLAPSGIPVYYYRCGECGFLFTTTMDTWTDEDMAARVYNSDYALADPDFAQSRPLGNAKLITQAFGASPHLRILDYGGGNGTLAGFLRAAGFAHVDTYDPFVPAHSARPSGTYDCIVSFEVMEHSPRPRHTLADINSLRAPGGLVLFSTLVQPPDLEVQGMGWWYISPRNGHVSLHSHAGLRVLADGLGLQMGSFGDGLHMLFDTLPAWARHLVAQG